MFQRIPWNALPAVLLCPYVPMNHPATPDPACEVSVDEFLTVDEAATLLKVHPKTIRRWCASARLPATMAGREYRIRRADLVSPSGRGEPRPATRVIAIANQKGGVG